MPDLTELTGRISLPELLFLAGVVLAVMAVMRITRLRAMRGETSKPLDRGELLAQLRPPVEPQAAPAARMTNAEASGGKAEELLRRLENRVKALEELLRAADRRIVELNALLHRQAGEARANVVPAHHQAESLERVRELALDTRGTERGEAGRLVDRYQAVYRLLDQGESAATVARKLGYPIGEVELIAGLRG